MHGDGEGADAHLTLGLLGQRGGLEVAGALRQQSNPARAGEQMPLQQFPEVRSLGDGAGFDGDEALTDCSCPVAGFGKLMRLVVLQ